MIFDIPYKKDINKGFLTKNFISILKSILDGNFSCLNFINLLKLDLLDFNKEDIYLLDNYIYMWDLEDKPFYEEFIYNPSGKKKLIENDNKILSKLNDIRLNITSLFKYLLENIKGVDAKEELLRYLFMFLDESKITEKLSLLDYDGYNKLVNIMEDLNDYMKESSNISTILDYIINLFETGNKQTNMQDEINISLLNMYDNNKYKMVYFIGLTEKDIPQKYNFNTLINENDIDDTYELIKNDSDLNNNLISNVLLNDNVIITYHKLNDDNKILSKSPLLNKFKNKEESFEYVVNKKINNDLDKKINNSLALKLYGEVLNLSPSGLEVLAKCKYSFFLNYGLKLKIKEKLVFDAREVGTFVHYILENAIKDKISVNEIEDKVNIYTNNYLTMNNYINGDINSFIIEELKKSTYILLEVIFDEISNTKLKPEKEELNLKDEPLSIKLDKGILNVSGIVDRLDSYIENNNYYFRIIDYKTGNKKFRLDDVLIGLNMQMLIYLTLIKENKKDINVIPTGFLYFPALVHYNKEYFNISEEEIINNIKSNIKMNGIVNCDYINLYNQNIDKFIDVTSRCKLNEEKVFSSSEIDNISSFVKKLLKEEVDSILNGDIRINPIKDNKNDSCAYCLFNSICKFNEKEDNYRKYKSLKNREALIKIEDILRK